jgi:hypothetical protein
MDGLKYYGVRSLINAGVVKCIQHEGVLDRIRQGIGRDYLHRRTIPPLNFKMGYPFNMLIQGVNDDTYAQGNIGSVSTKQLLPVTNSNGGIVGLTKTYPPITTT